MFGENSFPNRHRYLSATLCPSSTLISWEYLVMSGGSQRNSSSGTDQKYRPERCWGEAHVSRSSSLLSRRSHSSSQLQWSGFPPNDNAKEEELMIPVVARTWESKETKTKISRFDLMVNLFYTYSTCSLGAVLIPPGRQSVGCFHILTPFVNKDKGQNPFKVFWVTAWTAEPGNKD